jgi:mxaK protein
MNNLDKPIATTRAADATRPGRSPWTPSVHTVASVFAVLCLALAATAAWRAWQWFDAERAARGVATARGATSDEVLETLGSTRADPGHLLAHAQRLRQQKRDDDAIRILQHLSTRNDLDPAQRYAVGYNLGNALLSSARTALAAKGEDRGYTLVELAKQRYREVLRERPDDWDARHNLEHALRLSPELEPPPERETPTNTQQFKIDGRGMRAPELP